MKILNVILLAAVLTVPAAPAVAAEGEAPVAIAIHAGAGTIKRENLDAARESEIREKLEEAVRSGHRVLMSGGSSLDAVTRAVTILEDSPLFNAGRGAVFNAAGQNEMDASIMDGRTLNAGAVAAVRNIRNPVLLARRVMTDSAHVMLIGEGAETFAREQGIAFETDEWFRTEYRWQQLQQARERESAELSSRPEHWFSTVGAVALDSGGNLAAATSTGGMTNKRWGRVGDSPVIGAGNYAGNDSCAVSGTGHGEYFIRATVARDICARVQFKGESLGKAAHAVVMEQLPEMDASGGVIAMDPHGKIVLTFNTAGMYRASIDTDGNIFIGIYRDE